MDPSNNTELNDGSEEPCEDEMSNNSSSSTNENMEEEEEKEEIKEEIEEERGQRPQPVSAPSEKSGYAPPSKDSAPGAFSSAAPSTRSLMNLDDRISSKILREDSVSHNVGQRVSFKLRDGSIATPDDRTTSIQTSKEDDDKRSPESFDAMGTSGRSHESHSTALSSLEEDAMVKARARTDPSGGDESIDADTRLKDRLRAPKASKPGVQSSPPPVRAPAKPQPSVEAESKPRQQPLSSESPLEPVSVADRHTSAHLPQYQSAEASYENLGVASEEFIDAPIYEPLEYETVEGYDEPVMAITAVTVDDALEATAIVEEDPRIERARLMRCWFLCVCCTIVVAVAVAVPVGIVVTRRKERVVTAAPSDAPSSAPSMAPTTILRFDYRKQLERVSDAEVLNDRSSPQYKALEWMYEQDQTDLDAPNFFQRYALAVLYYSTDGDKWLYCFNGDEVCKDNKLSYLSSGDECLWFGNTCAKDDGKITTLHFATSLGNNLNGPIPNEISQLTALNQVYLQNNKVHGTLPESIGALQNLQKFYIQHNRLESPIPESFYNLTNLQTASLWNNSFAGPISPMFGDLPNLEILQLDMNEFTGTIPSELAGLSKLEVLSVADNQLTGSLPEEILDIEPLRRFSGRNNSLTGTIPSRLGETVNLIEYNVTLNKMHGPIPNGLFNATKLRRVQLGNNDFNGTISPLFGTLVNLRTLNFANNLFDGIIPDELGDLTKLNNLELHGNILTGTMPQSICSRRGSKFNDLKVLTSDCKGDIPEVICKCCSECFEQDEE